MPSIDVGSEFTTHRGVLYRVAQVHPVSVTFEVDPVAASAAGHEPNTLNMTWHAVAELLISGELRPAWVLEFRNGGFFGGPRDGNSVPCRYAKRWLSEREGQIEGDTNHWLWAGGLLKRD